MAVKSKGFLRKTAVLSVLLAAYFIASLFRSEVWGNILSPLNAFAAGGILYFAYLRSDRSVKVSMTLMMYSFACIAWGFADTLWAIMSLIGTPPEDSPIIWILYILPNLFLFASLVIFAIEQFAKWDFVQSIIDFTVSSFMTFVLFWILFLHKDGSTLRVLLASDFTSIVSIVTDIFICISIFSWFLSVCSGKIPAFLRMIAFGLVLFSFTDLYYYYIDYNSMYQPNSLVDFVYIASLWIIAFGALWKTYKSSSIFDLSVTLNTGNGKRWLYLLLYPFFAILFCSVGAVDIRLQISDYISFLVPIILYWGACKYIQISIEKETILKHQNELLEQRVAQQVSELTFLANQDTLTTLFNRRYFVSCLEKTIEFVNQNELIALMLIDLDRFKTINDTYGHDVGDKVLIEISSRMIQWNRYGATIARLGGDEFAVLFAGKYIPKDIEDYSLQMIEICNKPIDIANVTLSLTISVGIALLCEEGCDLKSMMKHADIAMYGAKSQGYNKYQFYNSIIDQNYSQKIEIESLLKQADIEHDFRLFYQPQYSLPDLKLIGAEALIRWENRELGFIPPNVFIPIAEEFEYIFRIGKWVMQETIRQANKWNSAYPTLLKVGFNISPKQFKDSGFIKTIEALITDHTGIDPSFIDAEITESVMIGDQEHADRIFRQLKKLGISISIDDFGSGYSSLGRLNKYPFDRIKLDKTLIDNLSSYSLSGTHIVRAAINMAHAAGIQVIAEGVEHKEQLEVLTELGCDQVQGYLFGRPVPAQIFEERFIKNHSDFTQFRDFQDKGTSY